jgi:hypothetical protein
MERYFEGLLYEKVNDSELRRRFRRAGGFCNTHSFQFAAYHDGLAGSILYRDLLVTWLGEGFDFPVEEASGVLSGCPACRVKAKTEENYVSLTADFLEDEQLKRALLSSDGLCLRHVAVLAKRLREGRRSMPSWLMEFQRDVVKRIVSDLSAYVDACNFSLGEARPSLSREQELAWKRAVRKVAGFPPIVETG